MSKSSTSENVRFIIVDMVDIIGLNETTIPTTPTPVIKSNTTDINHTLETVSLPSHRSHASKNLSFQTTCISILFVYITKKIINLPFWMCK